MNFPFQKTPEITGGIAHSGNPLTPWDDGSPAPFLIDPTTGALVTQSAGGPSNVQGTNDNAQANGIPNPILVAGLGFVGDTPSIVALRATFQDVDQSGILAVQLDPALTNTVVVSGTLTTLTQGNPGVTGDKATATASMAVITYAAGAGAVCNFVSSVHQSYSGSATVPTALAPGNLQIKDGSTVLLDIDITASGANSFYFDPPIQGTAATAMTVVLASGGTAVVGKINGRHYQQ